MSIFYLSCNDNAVIEIQHTQKYFDLQTHLVEFLADIFLADCSRFSELCFDYGLSWRKAKTENREIALI